MKSQTVWHNKPSADYVRPTPAPAPAPAPAQVHLGVGESRAWGFASKAGAYLAAEAQLAAQGPASAEDYAARVAICMGCDGRVDVMETLTDSVGFCTRCGCTSKRAALSVKLTMPTISCPLGKFAAVQGTGATVAGALGAVAGVIGSVIRLI